MKNHIKTLSFIAILTLLSLQAIAQNSLRDQFRRENSKSEPSYPEGFEDSVKDFSQTWNTIIEGSDFYVILERPPKKIYPNSQRGEFQSGNRILGLWKSDQFVFKPKYGSNKKFSWNDEEYQCNGSRHIVPEAAGRLGDDGFAKLRSDFWGSLSRLYGGNPADIEVNFETLECYYRTDFGNGLESKVRQCWVRKYEFGDRLITNQYKITEGFTGLIRQIRDTSGLMKGCQIK